MFYSEKAIDTFLSFKYTGIIKGSDATSKIINKETGDFYKIYTKLDNGKVVEAKFQAFGSVLVFTSLTACVELIMGKTSDEIREITVSNLLSAMEQCPKSKLYILHYAIDTLKKLADEMDEFLNLDKKASESETEVKKVKVNKSQDDKKEINLENTTENKNVEINQVDNKKLVESTTVKPKDSAKSSKTKIITITKDEDNNATTVLVENHDKMTAEDIKEIIDSKINEQKNEESLNTDVINKSNSEILNEEDNKEVEIVNTANIKKKHVKKDSLFADDDSSDVQDEIDDITAKLTEAIANLNFKLDDSEE